KSVPDPDYLTQMQEIDLKLARYLWMELVLNSDL
ncbi:hypothetical protein M2244_003601, partial [Rhodoferax antarcticus]|nr:hypothetical protein [Rhodoferax antarcticus]